MRRAAASRAPRTRFAGTTAGSRASRRTARRRASPARAGSGGAAPRAGRRPAAAPRRAEHERDDDERHVDPEHAAPAGVLNEQAAERRAERDGHLRGDRDRAEAARRRLAPRMALRPRTDHRDAGRIRGRRADPEHHACGDEPAERRRPRRERGGGQHDREPDEEDPLRAEAIREPAHHRLADRGREIEAGHEPHHVNLAAAGKRAPDVDERDRDHRRIQRVEQRAEHDRQHERARRRALALARRAAVRIGQGFASVQLHGGFAGRRVGRDRS